MTEVTFHHGVADPIDYICRLVRKAVRSGARVVLTGPATALAQFDRALWTFDPLEFLPHGMVRRGQPVAPRLQATPVWLLEDAAQAEHHEVLINIGAEPPPGFESFEKLIEIVPTDLPARDAARLRWRHYAARGYAIETHEVAR